MVKNKPKRIKNKPCLIQLKPQSGRRWIPFGPYRSWSVAEADLRRRGWIKDNDEPLLDGTPMSQWSAVLPSGEAMYAFLAEAALPQCQLPRNAAKKVKKK